MENKIRLDYYCPGSPIVFFGEGYPPKKGDVLGGEHKVKGVFKRDGITIVVLEALPR
jgi:hypothetical protein